MSKPEDKLSESMKVLRSATCRSISGKSTIKWQLGVAPDSIIHLRIAENDGGGFHSDEWVKLDDIQEALKDDRKGAAITSIRLIPLFKGKSVNTPSFLLAALRDLKLVRPMKNKQRHHERLDPGPFLEMVEKLMSSSPAVKTKKTPVKKTARKTVRKAPRKKAAVKKKAAPRKKAAKAV